eukprot:10541612-Lingulodinium_polyedra.AAC.1
MVLAPDVVVRRRFVADSAVEIARAVRQNAGDAVELRYADVERDVLLLGRPGAARRGGEPLLVDLGELGTKGVAGAVVDSGPN